MGSMSSQVLCSSSNKQMWSEKSKGFSRPVSVCIKMGILWHLALLPSRSLVWHLISAIRQLQHHLLEAAHSGRRLYAERELI